MSALREILARFGFSWDKAALKAADSGVESLVGKIGGVVAALSGGLFASAVNNFAAQLDVFDDLSAQTKIATDDLQLYSYAAKVSGSSQEEMFQSLTLLQKAMGRTTEATGPQVEAFKSLGVSLKDASGDARPLAEALPEVFANFKNLTSESKKSEVATSLFGRAGVKLIPLLDRGAEGLAELKNEMSEFGGIVSGETIKAAGDFRDNMVKLDTALFGLKARLANSLFPQLTKGADGLAMLIGRFGKWAETTTLADNAVMALGGSLVLTFAKGLAPYLKSGLKFGAIFLAFDELIGFLQGKDGLISRALDSAFGMGTAEKVRQVVLEATSSWGRFGDFCFVMVAALGFEYEAMWEDIKTLGLYAAAALSDAFDAVFNGALKGFQALVSKIPGLGDFAKGLTDLQRNGDARELVGKDARTRQKGMLEKGLLIEKGLGFKEGPTVNGADALSRWQGMVPGVNSAGAAPPSIASLPAMTTNNVDAKQTNMINVYTQPGASAREVGRAVGQAVPKPSPRAALAGLERTK